MPALHANLFARAPKSSVARKRAIHRAGEAACERLEPRWMLSTISWTNRNTFSGANDNRFDDVFGTMANQAIAVVDAAIATWQRSIASFNYGNGTNTYNLTVSMNAASSLAGLANGGFNTSAMINNKPAHGNMGIGWTSGVTPGTNSAAGWFIDPTPYDSSEFQGPLVNAFMRGPEPASGKDLFSIVMHELGHCMGLGATAQTKHPSVAFDSGIPDDRHVPASDPESTLWRYIGNQSLWTEWDSGGAASGTASNFEGPQHVAFPDPILGVGALALMNPSTPSRATVSDFEAECLQLAYGFTIIKPSRFGTMYGQLDADGTLRIDTSGLANSNDLIVINASAFEFSVKTTLGNPVDMIDPVGEFTSIFPATAVQRILINTGSGNDIVRIESNEAPCTVDGGANDDIIDFSFGSRNLSNIIGNTAVVGGSGNDQIYVYDDNQNTAQTFTITSARFDRPGWGGLFYSSDVEHENLVTGTSADTVNVQSTFANSPVYLFSAGGADTVNVGRALDGIRAISSPLTIRNDPSSTTLNINNGPDTGARTWNVDRVSTLGYLIGMAPANIYWETADISSINLTCGAGVDTGQFVISSGMFNLNNAGSNDFIRIGVPAANGLQLISGQITIDNSPAYTTLIIDDTGSSIARTIEFGEGGGYNTVLGFGPLIRFDSVDTLSTTLITGGGSDTVNVPRNDDTLIISNSGSPDTVNLGNSTNGLQSITGDVRVKNPTNVTSLFINDGPNTLARTPILDNVIYELGDYGSWSGLAPGLIEYHYADMSFINVTLGSGADVVAIRRSQGNLNMNTSGGADAYTIGGASNGAQGVGGEITFQNPTNHNSITVNDSGNTVGRNATLTDDLFAGAVYGWLTGLAPASLLYKYNDTSAVNIIHGSGSDTLAVRRHQDTLTIQGTSGNDTVTLGGVAGIGMNGVTAPVTVHNTSGATTLVLNDLGDTTAGGVVIHETNTLLLGRVTGMSPSTIDYRFGQVNAVRLRTSGYNNYLVMRETSPLTRVFYDPGAAGENLQVNEDSLGSAALYTDRSVNPNTTLIGSGGAIYQLAGGFVFRSGVFIMPDGLFDISDGALIHDFDEGSPLEGFREQITQGYNGGNWLGLGIRSSTAASTPGGAVGSAYASSIFSSFPATFAGQSVDETTVLVHYTLAGDANQDRIVDARDLLILANNWLGEGKTFGEGDFTYDGVVDKADLTLMAQMWQRTVAAPPIPSSPIPAAANRRAPVRTPPRVATSLLT